MASRLKLQKMLEDIISDRNVYFQPPESVKIRYPAIVYSLEIIKNSHADNSVYKQHNAYRITLIDENPDSEIVERISRLPMCMFNHHFKMDNLNHWVFTIYY